jgi:NTE family protein
LITRGYEAAEKRRDELLKYRVSDDEWQAWIAGREHRRKTTLPPPAFVTTTGVMPADAAIVQRALDRHLDVPLDIPALEHDLATLSGLDRYQSIDWQ